MSLHDTLSTADEFVPRHIGPRELDEIAMLNLLGGDPRVPIVYEVDRIRDGRSFTTRRVVATGSCA